MPQRETLYLFASAIPPVATCVLAFSFAFAEFRVAWLCALLIVLAMESRVQIGGRLSRTVVFWAHLSSSIPFFIALSALAFWAQPLWLASFASIAGVAAFCTGAILWYRGLYALMLHLSHDRA